MNVMIFILLLSFSASAQVSFKPPFFFGLATAPGHVEDQLDDIWLDWGRSGKTKAFLNQHAPERRLDFWTHPELELDLAQATGIKVFRLGIDWGRVMPAAGQFDESAIKRYHQIFKMIHDRKMKIMLTLMHHSVPKWIQKKGGWTNNEVKKDFLQFAQKVINEFQDDITYWITFNEGNVFAPLAYTAGMWPPGEKRALTSMMAIGPFKGETVQAMDHMSEVHREIYQWAHGKYPEIKMGIAHNMAYYTAKVFLDKIVAGFIDDLMNWRMPQQIQNHMDFFGFNYYGAEWIKGGQIDIDPEEEYSEAGRAIYPQGLYLILKEIHQKFPNMPIIITENGIADDTDILRPAYLIEHLKAIAKAKDQGIPVVGYIFWTLTDNMEWADGYCPKFGLVKVNRDKNLERTPRGSYTLFQQIIQTQQVNKLMSDKAWNLVERNVGQERPFCRADDGVTALDSPTSRKIIKKDWRFQ